ncbi:MAG: hypothetical protein A2X94_17610 [Bdellovibrionales bacterium GWB1_55_8]|nr:MAG: hypothetical protein A2X94_17610 [Bdellovibrionales bacterium GWB1_55_8]
MKHRLAHEPIVWFYKNVLMPFLLNSHHNDSTRLRAIADATGLPYKLCLESMLQPDALMLISRLSVMKHFLRELPSSGLPGCTSAVALKQWTKGGKLLVCRNLDYPIVGPWEKQTTVVFNFPARASGEMPHVSVTSAGIPVAGLTAINVEGLTLAAHAHFGKDVSLRGRAIVNIGDEIISRARTIGEAADIARRYRRIGNWAFVISSAREHDAAVIEMSPTQTRVRHADDGFIAHTNLFQTDLRQREGLISGGSYEDMVGRVCRIRQILERDRGSLEPKHLTAALGDHVDSETGEERVVGNIISVVTTIASIVLEPEGQRIWVSNRDESPTGIGNFLDVDLAKFWNTPSEERLLPGYRPKCAALIQGAGLYREAYRAWHMNNHEPDFREKTLNALRRTLEIIPSDGYVWVQAGIVAFSLRRFDESRQFLEQAGQLRLSAHVAQVRDLFLARCRDIAGDRQSAIALYRKYLTIADPKLRRAMKEGFRRRYRVSDTVRLMLDLQFADALQY